MGCCTKRKIRSANDQHERNPISMTRTEKMIRFLNSCRWTRSGMECVCCANPKAAVSDMESLSDMRQRSLLTEHYWNGATYHAQYVPTPLSKTIAQSTSSVRIHHFQCLNRSHCGRTFVPATMTI